MTTMQCAGLVAVLALLLSASTARAAEDTAAEPPGGVPKDRFAQDRFAIGFWVDPPADEQMEERYREIAEANFTLVIGGFGARTSADIQRQLELCEKFDLKAIVASYNADPLDRGNLPESPACWGYGIQDEPGAEEFAKLRAIVDDIRAKRPGKLAYINLLPTYVSPQRLSAANYDEYVKRFCEEVRVDVLSMDHYPQFKPGHDGRDAYCENLGYMRKYALAFGIPFWNFFNIMPYGPHTDPTEAQVRWQIYSSLAYGAKGVLYFCYYTPFSHEFPKGGAIITRDGGKTRHWYQARRINTELKNLGPTLMKLTSVGVYRVKPGDVPAEKLAGAPIEDLKRADHDPLHDCLIGVFQHEDGRRAVLLNNYHFAYTAWPTVEFDTDPARIVEVDKWSGKEIPLKDDSPDMDGLQISLDAGDGRLFLLPG